jgi:hypothetical protein
MADQYANPLDTHAGHTVVLLTGGGTSQLSDCHGVRSPISIDWPAPYHADQTLVWTSTPSQRGIFNFVLQGQ